ncbi:MAG: hypothetical protein KQA41_01690 [Candidatus Aenigmarchaeota archaeon]|nr:hypothetical protein [Candidatus Aenigmarchaeota archaeon]
MTETILICFSVKTKKFSNTYERNRFFKELYGWKQVIKKEKRSYEYKRDGLLDKIPHIKVDQSMFIILKRHLQLMEDFFKEWEDKIIWNEFEVLLDKEKKKLLEEWDYD